MRRNTSRVITHLHGRTRSLVTPNLEDWELLDCPKLRIIKPTSIHIIHEVTQRNLDMEQVVGVYHPGRCISE